MRAFLYLNLDPKLLHPEEHKKRQMAGIARAKARGVYKGRERAETYTEFQRKAKNKKALKCLRNGVSIRKTARACNLSTATIRKIKAEALKNLRLSPDAKTARNYPTHIGGEAFRVGEIDRGLANRIIIENHYSGKAYNNSTIHLGVWLNGELMGVLQYGYLLNPNSARKILPNTANDEALELNRMWLDDKAPRNSESKAISYSIKYLKRRFGKKIKFVQTFADERCGVGVVYQACSFKYYGHHTTPFYELDGKIYHRINATSPTKGGKAYHLLNNPTATVNEVKLKQYRYIKFLDPRSAKNCTFEERPYPATTKK